ncbi:MAG TPA: biotin--[acetyl-CoA-carboxylase] ligase, partial [Phycisphaerales bacterium]|nr:biotin--[acetyl-CoA-carboxylase] ligase [Phycisphaerales bacterium]
MLEVRRRLRAGEPPPFTVIAETQSGGVGRHGRPWSSPRGGWWLTTAVALPPERPVLADHTVLDVALWVRTVCEGTLGATMGGATPAVRIKWPNDIMVDDLKLAGVLIEVVPTAQAVVALIGVGVNADVHAADLDAGVRHRATSIRELTRAPIPPELAASAPELLSRKLQTA